MTACCFGGLENPDRTGPDRVNSSSKLIHITASYNIHSSPCSHSAKSTTTMAQTATAIMHETSSTIKQPNQGIKLLSTTFHYTIATKLQALSAVLNCYTHTSNCLNLLEL